VGGERREEEEPREQEMSGARDTDIFIDGSWVWTYQPSGSANPQHGGSHITVTIY
jgi:hypothetical protein